MANVTNNPSSASSTGTGDFAWTNVTNVFTSDNNRANEASSPNTDDVSEYLLATDYGFSIPSGATINGIEFSLERRDPSFYDTIDNEITLWKGGSAIAANKADTETFWETSDTTVIYGGSSDLWGETWSASDINASNFGAAIKAKTPNFGGADPEVDHMEITVYYTPPSTPTVTTSAVDNITTTSGDGNGEITDTGGADATERGFVYDTSSQSDPGNTSPASSAYSSVENETGTFGTGTFSLTMSGLSSNTTYYVRAYAENSEGFSYGGEVDFTTNAASTVSLNNITSIKGATNINL